MKTATRAPKGHPRVSCFALSLAEYSRRSDAAQQAVLDAVNAIPANRREEGVADLLYHSRRTLWAADFPEGFRLFVSDTELFSVTYLLEGSLPEMNRGQRLDYFDYGYLADILREHLLTGRPTKGDEANLRRALAWVKQKGRMLYLHDDH